MKKTISAGASVVTAALLVGSIGAAAPKPKLPKSWRGTAQYTYTYEEADRTVQKTMSASIVLVPVRGWTGNYTVSRGTVTGTYTEKTPSDGCTLTLSGSYPATKYLLTLQVSASRSARASFSGSEGGTNASFPATRTCPDGTSETTAVTGYLDNPFFMLTRHTGGFPVKASLTRIAGSLRTAQSGGVWTLRYSFVGKR
jgi:hypothetical protein